MMISTPYLGDLYHDDSCTCHMKSMHNQMGYPRGTFPKNQIQSLPANFVNLYCHRTACTKYIVGGSTELLHHHYSLSPHNSFISSVREDALSTNSEIVSSLELLLQTVFSDFHFHPVQLIQASLSTCMTTTCVKQVCFQPH